MSDFCITAVRYSQDESHIQFVRVHEEITQKARIGPGRVVPRAFVADPIRLGKASFQTRILNTEQTAWMSGAPVHLIDGEFLTTNKNSKTRDNLENLPKF